MKFGNYLQENTISQWSLEYMQYDMLKIELKKRQFDHPWSQEDEDEFINLYLAEKQKVNQSITNFNQQIQVRIKHCERLLQGIDKTCSDSATLEFLNSIDDTLVEIIYDLNDFSSFIQMNRTGFEKILKKHKKWTGIEHSYSVFYNATLEFGASQILYGKVSILRRKCYEYIYRNKNVIPGDEAIEFGSSRPSSLAVSADKIRNVFWIHADSLSEVTAVLCMNSHTVPVFENIDNVDFSLSEVFFDNSQMGSYLNDLSGNNASVIRCTRHGSSPTQVYLENETRSISSHSSVFKSQKFKLQYNLLNDFCKGTCIIPPAKSNPGSEGVKEENPEIIGKAIQKSIISDFQRPVLTCNYNRLSFETMSNQVTIMLDTNISYYSQERANDIFLPPTADSKKKEFPYAVLEINIPASNKQFESPSLNWLNVLVQNSELVCPVPNFSKYLQGISQLIEPSNQRRTSSVLPFTNLPVENLPSWFTLFTSGIHPATFPPSIVLSESNPLLQKKISAYNVTGRLSAISNASKINFRSNSVDFTAITMVHSSDQDSQCPTIQTDNVIDMKKPHFETSSDTTIAFDQTSSFDSDSDSESEDTEDQRHCSWNKTSTMINFELQYKRQRQKIKQQLKSEQELEGKKRKKNKKKSKKNKEESKEIKIEPKVFFANERTFISWLQFCALLLTVALNLLNFGDKISRVCGGLFLAISVVLCLYALARFQYRAWQLRTPSQEGRFDDVYGPAVLCVLIVAALVINFWLRFKQPSDGSPTTATATGNTTPTFLNVTAATASAYHI